MKTTSLRTPRNETRRSPQVTPAQAIATARLALAFGPLTFEDRPADASTLQDAA